MMVVDAYLFIYLFMIAPQDLEGFKMMIFASY